jgi:gas vesicle protein
MNAQQFDDRGEGHRHYGFAIGLLTGAFAGAALAVWFAPRFAAELRERVTDSARGLGERASERYDQMTTRFANVATEVTRQAQDVRDDVAEAVAHGAHEVERLARASKTR